MVRAIINNDDILFLQSRIIKKKNLFGGVTLFFPLPPIIHRMTWLKRGLLSCLPAVCNLVFYLEGYDVPLSDSPYILTYKDTSAL